MSWKPKYRLQRVKLLNQKNMSEKIDTSFLEYVKSLKPKVIEEGNFIRKALQQNSYLLNSYQQNSYDLTDAYKVEKVKKCVA